MIELCAWMILYQEVTGNLQMIIELWHLEEIFGFILGL
jgi:hypothetical protein